MLVGTHGGLIGPDGPTQAGLQDISVMRSIPNIKIFQPDLNEIYFNEGLRGITKIKIPIGQADVNDWRKYYYNMEILFDNFSKNIIKPEKKWLKETTKNKIKKDLKKVNAVIQTVK